MKFLKSMFLFSIIVFTFIFMYNNSHVCAYEKSKSVLILNSYHRGLGWSDKIEEGILSKLKTPENNYIDIKIEYMDSKENADQLYHEKLVELYKDKYKYKKFDLIICSDNVALDFFIQYGKEVFKDIPIVFCGINDFSSYDSNKLNNMTGISEDIDIYENIKLISKLHPNTKSIDVVIDTSYIGEIVHNELVNLKKEKNFSFEINEIREDSIESIISKINKNNYEKIVLFMSTYTKDIEGKKMYASKSANYMKEKIQNPVYTLWDSAIGYGVIGGKVTSGFEQGKYSGEITLKILNGESPNNIPFKRQYGIKYMFDYNELKKFSIDLYKIPKDSIIINQPPSVYSLAKDKFKKAALSIVLIFIIIILLLIINILNRRKLERNLNHNKKKLEKNLNFLRTLLNTIPNPIFCIDSKGKYTECNIHYENLIGLERKDIINHTVVKSNQDKLFRNYSLKNINLVEDIESKTYETKIKFHDGTIRDVLLNEAPIIGENNKVEGIVGVMLDITERKKVEYKITRMSNLKEAMLEINQSIIGIDNIQDLFDLILEKAVSSINGATYGSILLLTEDNNIRIIAQKGYDKEKIKEFCIPLEQSFTWIYTKGKIKNTVIINNIDKFNTINSNEFLNEKEKWVIKSCISAPLVVNGKLYGMLNIDSNKSNAFTEEDLEIMDYMRNQVEIAISKHMLYDETIYLSRYDKLTNIYNRRYFEDILHNKLKSVKQFKLVVFDLNRLKFINDNYGHLSGDKYIKIFIEELKLVLKENDVIARVGGDEFIGIFYDDIDILNDKFEKLLHDLRDTPLNFENNKVYCSFSYGIASFPEDSAVCNKLIKIADDRMYECKKNMNKI